MQRITVNNYKQGMTSETVQEEILESLSDVEKQLAKAMKIIEIRGKKGRKVPVLLTQSHQDQIELLNNTRKLVNVDQSNIYLFPRLGMSSNPIRSSDVLRKFSAGSGAQKPEQLNSTSLRKHVATVTQLLNLKENELDIVAGFMGHDIKVHREYYRLPDETLQLCKVSKILLNMEKGKMQKMKGMSLDEITVTADGMTYSLLL